MHIRPVYFPYAVILKSLLGPTRLHFEQFKQTGDYKSGHLGRWEIGTAKIIARWFKYTSVTLS